MPNQRIVPFVEDHRNLLILAPVHELPLEAMATLQAALKRGIEMTFQIEESELVAEPLPKLDARRALLFYEAAEGGAGVLTRLANDSASLALVAQNALRLLHHQAPVDGIWRLEDLPSLEETDSSATTYAKPAAISACSHTLTNQTTSTSIAAISRRSNCWLQWPTLK